MKIFSFIVVALLLFSVSSFAGDTVLGLNVGTAITSFEGQTESASSFSFGAHLGKEVLPILETGLEFNMLASPWEFKGTSIAGETTVKISQTIIGAYAKVNIPLVVVNPYARAGIGYYMGNIEATAAGQTGKQDFKGAVGFNLGAGVNTFMGIYAELVYHIVSRTLDVEGAEAVGYNNIMINAGYNFSF